MESNADTAQMPVARTVTMTALIVWFAAACIAGLTGVVNEPGRPPLVLLSFLLLPMAGFVAAYRISAAFRAFCGQPQPHAAGRVACLALCRHRVPGRMADGRPAGGLCDSRWTWRHRRRRLGRRTGSGTSQGVSFPEVVPCVEYVRIRGSGDGHPVGDCVLQHPARCPEPGNRHDQGDGNVSLQPDPHVCRAAVHPAPRAHLQANRRRIPRARGRRAVGRGRVPPDPHGSGAGHSQTRRMGRKEALSALRLLLCIALDANEHVISP